MRFVTKKEIIAKKLENILDDLNLNYEIDCVDNERIKYIIKSNDSDNSITICVLDTDIKEIINEFGIRIKYFEYDDEVSIYGYGIDEYKNFSVSKLYDELYKIIY